MRDPARIDRILSHLGRYWRANPDLRLGQIVSNVATLGRISPVATYYIEDDVQERYLAEQVAKLPFDPQVAVAAELLAACELLAARDRIAALEQRERDLAAAVLQAVDLAEVCSHGAHKYGSAEPATFAELRAIAAG